MVPDAASGLITDQRERLGVSRNGSRERGRGAFDSEEENGGNASRIAKSC